jgi:seryl-tRNA synthetase
MLDILDFQEDKGGNLNKLRESQRRRYAAESTVDDIVTLFEDHKKSMPILTLLSTGLTWQ